MEDENSEDENYEEESSLGHQKILSEAIVFGCLQKELYPELNTFAPTVQISRENVVFYFYDSENDILIESSVFELFEMIMDDENDQLTFETILALWLTLNYRYLSSGVTHSMLERIDYRARFWEQLPSDKRKIYSKNLRIRNTREGKRSTSQVRISAGRRLFWSPARDVRGH